MDKKLEDKITITGRGINITVPIRKYIFDKLSKHIHHLKDATGIDVVVQGNVSHRGVSNDFRVEIVARMPKAVVRVEDYGKDVYATVDELEPVLKRRLERYAGKMRQWNEEEPWEIIENEVGSDTEGSVYTNDVDLSSLIVRHKQYSNNSPMHIAEAIERLELIGHPALLFRNITSGKYSMIYKTGDGYYGLVEPKEG